MVKTFKKNVGTSVALLGIVLLLAAILAAVTGWVLNIVHIVHHISEPAYPAIKLVVEILGVLVFPLGCLLGWV